MYTWSLALMLLALAPTEAAGAESDFDVEIHGCDRVDAAMLEQLLALELKLVVSQAATQRRYRVELRCDEAETVIGVEDPLTDKRLERRLPVLAPNDPDPARTVAIAASQLFVASWAEFGSPPPSEHPPLPAAAVEQAAAVELVTARSSPGDAASMLARHRLEHSLILHAGQRARGLDGTSLRLTEVALGYAPRFLLGPRRRIALGPTFAGDIEIGATRRIDTRVQALLAGGRVGLDLRVHSGHEIGLWAGLDLGLTWQQLHARPDPGTGLVGGRVSGFGVDPSAHLGFVLDTGRVDLALALEGGYLVSGPLGLTPDGPVTVRGGWIGGGLQIGIDVATK
jgi:hypothetical protein